MLNINRKPSTVITIVHKSPDKTYTWTPQTFERVLFLSEGTIDRPAEWRSGFYVGLHNDVRGLRSPDDTRTGKFFEGSPIHNETDENGELVVRALIWDANDFVGGNNRREWVDVGYIIEMNRANVDTVHELNEMSRARQAAERLMAFGEVEAAA